MAKEYRQNTNYNDIIQDSGQNEENTTNNSGNTGLPFGLCKKYGIEVPADATPRDAWNLLEGKTGITPNNFYKKLANPQNKFSDSTTEQINELKSKNVYYNQVKKLSHRLSQNEIINKIGGEDRTSGSCVSLAFAYCANIGGYDVIDFRGGESTDFFADYRNIREIQRLDGVKSQEYEVISEAKETAQILIKLDYDKEYMLTAGKHSAIVKRCKDGLQYLELQQNGKNNGWQSFYKYGSIIETLKQRFKCLKNPRTYKMSDGRVFRFKQKISLIEVDTLTKNQEFLELMGYINTSNNEQKKGD